MFKEKITSLISLFILIGFIWDCNYLFLSLPAFFCFTYNIAILVIKYRNTDNSKRELKIKLEYLIILSCVFFLAGILAYRNTLESCSIFWKLSILTFFLTIATIILLEKKYNLLNNKKSYIFFIALFYSSLISTSGVYINKYVILEKNVNIHALILSKEINKGTRGNISHIIRFKNINDKVTKLEVNKSFYDLVNESDEINLLTNKGILGCHYILKISKGANIVDIR